MTKDDVIRLAQEAGATISQGHRQGVIVYEDGGNLSPMVIYRFADLIAAAVRERCAMACEEFRRGLDSRSSQAEGWATDQCAAAIRALSDTEGGAA